MILIYKEIVADVLELCILEKDLSGYGRGYLGYEVIVMQIYCNSDFISMIYVDIVVDIVELCISGYYLCGYGRISIGTVHH